MNDRTMIKVNATETCLVFRTVSPKRKSPRSFYVLRSELERLEQYGSITASDLGCFAVFQQDTVSGLVRIRFSWLQQNSACELAGYEEVVVKTHLIRPAPLEVVPEKAYQLAPHRLMGQGRVEVFPAVKNHTGLWNLLYG